MSNYETNLTIKSWAEEDRPREKLIQKGRSSLSDAELIAILLGSGSKEESAVELSRKILNSVKNDLNDLGKLSVNDLMKFKGVGEAKAISIIAAIELGRRRKNSSTAIKNQIISSKDAFDFMNKNFQDLSHEEFWIIYLNKSNKIILHEKISAGGISATVADIRLILKKALEVLATSIIILHNHPSGNIQPSHEDKKLTQTLKEATKLMDILLIDHLIISENQYYSFADEGIL